MKTDKYKTTLSLQIFDLVILEWITAPKLEVYQKEEDGCLVLWGVFNNVPLKFRTNEIRIIRNKLPEPRFFLTETIEYCSSDMIKIPIKYWPLSSEMKRLTKTDIPKQPDTYTYYLDACFAYCS
jgi:hypothetical protein